jgi:hypothetical protein
MQQQYVTRTPMQQAVVDQLVRNFNIQGDRVLFLSRQDPIDPWIPYDQLVAIARQSGRFQSIAESYVEYISDLKQLIHSATVIDPDGRSYIRSGAATIGEKLPNEEIPDEHALAAARALKAALDAAGFNPVKAAPILDLNLQPKEHEVADQAESRRQDLKTIHALAEQKGLIVPLDEDASQKDFTAYRGFLETNFGTKTTVSMGPSDRARVINALRNLPDLDAPKNVAWRM